MTDFAWRIFGLVAASAILCLSATPAQTPAAARSERGADGYFVPVEVPSIRYRIDARIDLQAGFVEGRETVELRNDSFAPGIVAIHGLETYRDGESPRWWRHIVSHEIGHQDWGEWVLDGDEPSWLWIGLGIHADTEFMIARNYDPDRRVEWVGNYIMEIRSLAV